MGFVGCAGRLFALELMNGDRLRGRPGRSGQLVEIADGAVSVRKGSSLGGGVLRVSQLFVL